jgi:hypothetical protein
LPLKRVWLVSRYFAIHVSVMIGTDAGSSEIGDMDRDVALKLLRGGPEGIAEWNRRRERDEEIPSLCEANLIFADLSGANLNGVDFTAANLRGARFSDGEPDGDDLVLASLVETNLNDAQLQSAFLVMTNLSRADLSGADLSDAILNLADLSEAALYVTKLNDTWLYETDFSKAKCAGTVFSNLDLSEAKGLESVIHGGPSSLGIDTVIRSRGKIPEVFLHQCGLPKAWIKTFPSLLESFDPIQFYSCFISYNTHDEKFATRLYSDLTDAGIRCWKWNHDARTGQPIWSEIDRAIKRHDKLILIASKWSLTSPQVIREIERALQEEDNRSKQKIDGKYVGDTNVLFPIRLDDYVLKGWVHERRADVVAKTIADARKALRCPEVYVAVRDRLINDLKADHSGGVTRI